MDLLQTLKLHLLVKGISISDDARNMLTHYGRVPFSYRDYATTGGITLVFEKAVFINAPFDSDVYQNPECLLDFDRDAGVFVVNFQGNQIPVEIVPLPGYLDHVDSAGRPVVHTAFSHADRARISPVYGCTMRCRFCDIPDHKYQMRHPEQLLEAIDVVLNDKVLPVKHILITGGTPSPKDYENFDNICCEIVKKANLPVDVMMPPRPRDPTFISRLFDMGVKGFSINIEIFDQELSKRITPEKSKIGIAGFENAISKAVEVTGGRGRVRSLLLVGLEPLKSTLEAVHFLARLGCDPVLSPFRTSENIPLAHHPVPTIDFLERVYSEAANVVEKYGVKLGPRCIPCQHNTLTFPDNSGSYYFS